MDVMSLSAKINLDSSGYESALRNSERSFRSYGDKISSWAVAKGQVIAGLAKSAAASVKNVVSDVIGEGKSFDTSMSQVAATMGKSVADMEKEVGSVETTFGHFEGNLRDFARYMGANTAFSATEAADALNYMALAGYDTQTSMQMLPNVLNLAAAGSVELARASDMVTDAQSALGLTLDQTDDLVDQMAKTSSKTNTSVEQLGDAILSIGAAARGVRGGTTELNAVLGMLANNGIKGSYAGTKLRSIISHLATPAKEAGKAISELGVNIYGADGKMRAMPEIFADMQKKMAKMSEKNRNRYIKQIFGEDNLSAVQALLGVTSEEWAELMGQIEDSEGAAAEMAETQLDNLAGDTTKFNSALSEAKLIISEALTPTLRKFVQFGTRSLSRLTAAFGKGGFAAVGEELKAIFGEVVTKLKESDDPKLQALGTILENLASAARWVKLAFTDLPSALSKLKIKAKSLVDSIQWPTWEDIKGSLKAAWEKIKTKVADIASYFGGLVFGKNDAGEVNWPTWEQVKDKAKEEWEAIKTKAASLAEDFGKLVFGTKENGEVNWPTWEQVKDAAKTKWNEIKAKAASLTNDFGKLVFGTNEKGEVKWPTWDDIKLSAKLAWFRIKQKVSSLGEGFGKLVFGTNEKGEVNWPKWKDVKEAAETAWNSIKEEAAKLKGLVLGDSADAADIFERILSAFNDIKSTVEQGAIDIATWFFGEENAGTISSAISALGDAIPAIGVALATYFTVQKIQGFIQFIGNLKDLFTSGVGKNKVGLILAGIAAAITLIIENWDKIEPALQQAGEWINENLLAPINEFIESLKEVVKQVGNVLGLDTSGWFGGKQEENPMLNGGTPVGDYEYRTANISPEQADSLYQNWKFAKDNPNALTMWNGEKMNMAEGFKNQFADILKGAGFDDATIKDLSARVNNLSDEGFRNLMVSLMNAQGYYDESGKKVADLGSTSETTTADIVGLGSAAQSAASELNSINVGGEQPFSNAKGLWTVPYDDYLTRLHRGERVLSASQARKSDKSDSNISMGSLFNGIVGAVRTGMENANVNSFLNGRDITDDVSRDTLRRIKSRRFAT